MSYSAGSSERGSKPRDQCRRWVKIGRYGLRLYEHDRDEEPVCRLCWENALPGGRPFPLLPEAAALSFGRICTGPFAQCAPASFYVADDLTNGKLIGYLAGADGSAVETPDGAVPWLDWRDRRAHEIAEDEFGEISPKLCLPGHQLVEGTKLLYAMSLGPRAIQFLLHAKLNSAKEMPGLPACPEYHFQVDRSHRGQGIGGRLVELFVSGLKGAKYKEIGAQVTVCDGQVPLTYYERMSVRGKRLWSVYDRRESAIYCAEEKIAWGLGPVVENVGLVADKSRLLAFVRRGR
jgi:GNAT superfamily N-acetyltransferase